MKKVLVIGDTMIDHYIFGNVTRLNPEAPHTVILNHLSDKRLLGGAANVAANLASTTDCKIDYLGVVNDEVADRFSDFGISSTDKFAQPVLEKKRFICGSSYLLRVDEGTRYSINANEVCDFLKKKSEEKIWDLILVSDYNKGTVTKEVLCCALEIAKKHGTYVIVDLKTIDNMDFYKFDLNQRLILKSNQFESVGLLPGGRSGILAKFTTLGDKGCRFFTEEWFCGFDVPVLNKNEVRDVVGAGDSFLVGMACSYLEHGLDFKKMAETGNKFAEAKIRHFGTYVLKKEDIK